MWDAVGSAHVALWGKDLVKSYTRPVCISPEPKKIIDVCAQTVWTETAPLSLLLSASEWTPVPESEGGVETKRFPRGVGEKQALNFLFLFQCFLKCENI